MDQPEIYPICLIQQFMNLSCLDMDQKAIEDMKTFINFNKIAGKS